MRAMSIAAIVTALTATAPISAAADQIITEPFSLTIPNSVVPDGVEGFAQFDSTPFPLFAPSIGALKSVSIAVSGAVTVASLETNPGIAIILQGNNVMGDDDSSIISQSGTTNLNLSGTDQTPSYIGTGNGLVELLIGSNDKMPNESLIASDGPLNGVVTYTYTPLTLAIPETPTWAAMLVGFTRLGFAGCRAKRKAAIRV
jgi:hypothetical protein